MFGKVTNARRALVFSLPARNPIFRNMMRENSECFSTPPISTTTSRLYSSANPQAVSGAIIAIHSKTLGPSVGGCRILPYADDQTALTDVLRLPRG